MGTKLPPLPIAKLIPLVTGGGSGIGRGIVDQLIQRGASKVLICGRRELALKETQASYPKGTIEYTLCDTGNVTDRINLFKWVQRNHPDCNALINNAGVIRQKPLVNDLDVPWEDRLTEININLNGPIHLCTLFLPHFLQKKDEVTVLANVSSILAFIPYVGGPVNGATKAALHSFTLSLRNSLQETNVRVLEIVPTTVNSSGDSIGEKLDDFVLAVMDRIEAGELEVGFKLSETARLADRTTMEQMMNLLAANTPKFPASYK